MKFKYLILSLLFVILLTACSHSEKYSPEEFSQLESIYIPEYAKGFEIREDPGNGNVVIRISDPWIGAKEVTQYFLIKGINGSPHKLSSSDLKKDIAQRIVCMSSTHVALLEAIDALDNVVGVSGKNYISNDYIRNNDSIYDVGYEGNMDYESLLAAKPDLVLLYSVNGSASLEAKLKEFKIPFLYIGDYVEEDPLGKAEWMVVLGEVTGKRNSSMNNFNKISQRYNTLKDSLTSALPYRPSIMVNAPFADAWYMPSSDSYVAKLIRDAGGDYIYKGAEGNTNKIIDKEEALELISKADYWINPSTTGSLNELSHLVPVATQTNCFKDGKIFNNNLRSSLGGGNDFYESGIVNPDLVLRDLIKIFHPELISEEFVYYQHLE